ncbi:flavoprotein [Pseudonocardia sp.]|uniref:flavoprotein n=1 Tax=Pseudonocardia sp. TaxID=60912 RepID=UPI0026186986|nr:flavoprotein [Pseudonocardia sp.]
MAARVAYVIACSAPPVLDLTSLLDLLTERGWASYVILTPTAAAWVDVDALADASGHPVRIEPRRPADPDPLPPADVVIAAPLTFNSLNKWAAGISDTLALGLLNEALGLGLPIIAAPCVKEALRQHPAYPCSVERLRSAGVTVLDTNVVVHSAVGPLLDWPLVLPP